jgi:hypothetical protein
MRRLSYGYTVIQAHSQLGISLSMARDRVRELKRHSGAHTLPHLMYWMHTNYHLWPQVRKHPTPNPGELRLAVLQMRAWGHSAEAIQTKLYLSKAGYERRINETHRITRTNNDAHAVSVCWSEDMIV